ncbi:Pollen receptor-like kinase [Arachis hypogaea]|nr:Pollen receptor-like kinase [Arachis hypogaea]
MRLSFVNKEDDRKEFNMQDLLKASAEILGSGCYSSSYKASLLSGPMVVVKRFKQMNNSFYYRREEKLLITDFVPNGSLAVCLHGHQALGQPSLDWPTRLKIANSSISPHGHLKSSNILLNENYEPILTDYGLVPVINQELASDIMCEVFDKEMGTSKENEVEIAKLLRIALACCETDVEKRLDVKEAVNRIQKVKESGEIDLS